MSLKTSLLLLTTLCWPAFAQDERAPWAAELNAGNAAFGTGNYPLAAQKYREALAKSEESGASPTATLPILRTLAIALRSNAEAPGAQQVLERTLAIVKEVHGESSVEIAPILSELALVQRAQDLRSDAVKTLKAAMLARSKSPRTPELARDATLLATIHHEMGEDDMAEVHFRMALHLWGSLPDSGMQVLTAIDPLASIYRNRNDYKQAEELYTWALRLREAAMGPKDAELIGTLDSLAYVLFGLKKYEEAEVIYNRLLALWEMVGGPEHPMAALVLDKMVEFYAVQKKYDMATPLAERALAMRSKKMLESVTRRGTVLTKEGKMKEAADLLGRGLRIASDARVADEDIGNLLTVYAFTLRELEQDKEAAVIGKRLKEAMERKIAKEGKRDAPPSPKP